MKFRKFAAAAAAVAVLGAAAPVMGLSDPLSVTASAEEVKLLVSENVFGEFDESYSLGEGYYALLNTKTTTPFNTEVVGTKIVYCGTDVIENWRKTGKLEYTTVSCGTDISGMTFKSGVIDENGGIVKFASTSQDETICHVFTLDKAKNELTEAYSYPIQSVWSSVSSRIDGYSFVEDKKDWQTWECTYSVYDAKGNRTQKTISPKNYDGSVDYSLGGMVALIDCYGKGKYVGYACVADYATKKTVPVGDSGNEIATFIFEISGINKDGSLTPLTEVRSYGNMDISPDFFGGENYVAWKNYDDGCYYVMTLDDGKTYKLDGGKDYNTIVDVVGTNAIVFYSHPRAGHSYNVVDLKTGKIITDNLVVVTEYTEYGAINYSKLIYKIFTCDEGKTFLVSTESFSPTHESKWCILDSSCNILGSFDDASNFYGNGMYAPVVQDGKGWLVDKDMNQVSEKIDAVSCLTFGEELFQFTNADGEKIFVTTPESGIADVPAEPETPEEPETPTEPETPEEPAKKVEFKDEEANVVVTADEGAVPEGAELVVKALTDEDTDTRTFFDLGFAKDGEDIQPEGEVSVTLPVPEALKGKDINVYRVEKDDKYTKLEAVVDGEFITFTTSHFSKYLLTSETIAEATPENPDTGIVFAFSAIALSGAAVLVSRKKNR